MGNIKGNVEQKVKASVKKAAIKAIVAALLKPVIAIIIGSGIILAITALWDSLLDSFSKETGATMESRPVEYEANTEDGDTTDGSKYAIRIEDEQIEDMEKILENMGTSKERLHLYKEPEEGMTDEEIEECKKAYLKKIYAAEVISKEINRSYRDEGAGPQLYPENPEKYYGRVYVKRADQTTGKEDRNKNRLCYIDYDSFFQLDADHIMNYFTIKEPTEDDPNDRLCVAGTVVTKDEITGDIIDTQIIIQELDYKKDLIKYMTPVEFLLDLAIITENPEFVAGYSPDPDLMGLAERILKNTEIYLTVMTRTVKTTTDTVINYQIETKAGGNYITIDKDGNVKDQGSFDYAEGQGQISDGQPTETKISCTEKIPKVAVTYVNTWFLEHEYIYNKVKLPDVIIGPDTSDLNPSETDWIDQQPYTTSYSNNDGTTTTTTVYPKTREINRTQTITKTIEEETYQPGISKDPRYKIDEIIKLLRTEFEIPETFVKQAPIGKIVNGAGTLLNMLSGSERTQSVEHIMRYTLYVYTGEDYGVTELDSNIFESNGYLFNSATAASDLTTYLRQFAHSNEAPQSADGKYYQMYGDGAGWPTIGNADLQWASHHSKFNVPGRVYDGKQELQVENVEEYVNGILGRGAEATYSDDEINAMQIYIEKELVDSIGSEVANGFYNKVLNATQGLNLSRQQLYALTAIAHNFGHLPERNGKTFSTAYEEGAALYGVDTWEQNRYIWDNWWCYLGGGMAGHIPARDAAFETYVKGIYDFSQSAAGKVFGRNYYIYYTQQQLAMYSYAPQKRITRDPNNQAHEEEIFTSTHNSLNTNGVVDIDNSEYGTYTNSQGRTFVEFKQGTGPWASMQYGTDENGNPATIAYQGCSITCLAIVASGYGYDYTPDKWAGPNTVSIDGTLKGFLRNSKRTGIVSEGKANNVTSESDKAAIQEHLKHDAVIIHVLGPNCETYNGDSPFTNTEHWMVLLDISSDGSQVYVSNPGSKTNGWVNIDEALKSLCCYITVSQ